MFPAGASAAIQLGDGLETVGWESSGCTQYIISLSGIIEIGLEDGTTHRFVPGDARLVEDTTGRGHTTLVPGDEPSITAVIPLT